MISESITRAVRIKRIAMGVAVLALFCFFITVYFCHGPAQCAYSREVEYIGIPTLYFSLIFLLLSLLSSVFHDDNLKRWLWFSLAYVPLGLAGAMWLVQLRGFFGDLTNPGPAPRTWLFAVPYLVISILIILWPSKKKKPEARDEWRRV